MAKWKSGSMLLTTLAAHRAQRPAVIFDCWAEVGGWRRKRLKSDDKSMEERAGLGRESQSACNTAPEKKKRVLCPAVAGSAWKMLIPISGVYGQLYPLLVIGEQHVRSTEVEIGGNEQPLIVVTAATKKHKRMTLRDFFLFFFCHACI